MLSGFFIRVLGSGKDGFAESEALSSVIHDCASDFDVEVKHAGDYTQLGQITAQVKQAIQDADVVFADAGSENQNVWYEIGYADHVGPHKVICLYHSDRPLPFDRQDLRAVRYEKGLIDSDSLRKTLKSTLRDLLVESKLAKLLEDGMDDVQQRATSEYLSLKKLRTAGVSFLLRTARETKSTVRSRTRALKSLAMMGELDQNAFVEFSDPLIHEDIRVTLYDLAKDYSSALPQSFWDRALVGATGNYRLLTAVVSAALHHWFEGRLDERWFRQQVFRNIDPRFPNAALAALQTKVPPVPPPTSPRASTIKSDAAD